MQKTQDFFVALHIYGAQRGAQNGKKVEFWAVYSLQLWFSSLKSAHLGCYGHLDIMNKSLLKTGELFVALRIFGALRGAQNGPKWQKKLERWAVNSLQLGFSSPKSAYLGCVGHLDIVKNNTRAQKTKKK